MSEAMSTLLSFGGKHTREQLALVETPPATATYHPVPHSEVIAALIETGEHEKPGAHAAFCSCLPLVAVRKLGYHCRNSPSNSLFRTFVRIWTRRWAPFLDHCICCCFTIRLLITWFTVDSTNAVEIRS